MGKIIKQSVERLQIEKKTFILGMKGEFYIEFATDRFGPYEYKFERIDTYYNDGLKDRGSVMFPLKEKKFNNTEIFIERDGIVIAVGKRGGLTKQERWFVDLINIKTEKKYRVFTDEVSLIYCGRESEKEFLFINFNDNGVWRSLKLDSQTMEVLEEKKERLYAFFKIIYNETEDRWYRLEFKPANPNLPNTDEKKFQNGWFIMRKINIQGKPSRWDRKEWTVELDNRKVVDVWEESVR